MARNRRHIDITSPAGITAVLLVAGASDDRAGDRAAACREALRETDAVLEERGEGVTAVLLRHLRLGVDDTEVVARRVRLSCEAAGGEPVRIAVAVAETGDEPLDQLLTRAQQVLDSAEVTPTR